MDFVTTLELAPLYIPFGFVLTIEWYALFVRDKITIY